MVCIVIYGKLFRPYKLYKQRYRIQNKYYLLLGKTMLDLRLRVVNAQFCIRSNLYKNNKGNANKKNYFFAVKLISYEKLQFFLMAGHLRGGELFEMCCPCKTTDNLPKMTHRNINIQVYMLNFVVCQQILCLLTCWLK